MTEHKKPPQAFRLYTIPDIANEAQVSQKTVRRWISDGDLIAHRLGRQIRVTPEDWKMFVRVRRQA